MTKGPDGLWYVTTTPQVVGFHCYESPGTAHEWLTWRRCFKEFAPLLFR
jgi:hypothetical protein